MAWQEAKRVGIIGAGVAGLATAKTLLADGIACTIFERGDRLGGVWADGYSNLGVQVQKELYEFPDWPLPSDAPNFTPGPIFQKYLEDYADFFHLRSHIRLRSRITKLTPRAACRQAGGGCRLRQERYRYSWRPPITVFFCRKSGVRWDRAMSSLTD